MVSHRRDLQPWHYNDVITDAIASQFTSLAIVYSTVNSDTNQRKHQSSASLAFVWGLHRGPVNSPHKWPVTRKMFPFDDVIMTSTNIESLYIYIFFHWLSSSLGSLIKYLSRSVSICMVFCQWRHSERDGISTHWRLDRLLKAQSSASLAFVRGIHRSPKGL